MGQKVHPYGFRVGYNKDWHSHWFAKHDFAKYLAEDLKLKRDLKKRFRRRRSFAHRHRACSDSV
jgi:small subunit ribosomal protein S3